MFCGRYFIGILSTLTLWQMASIASGETRDEDKGSEIFSKYHTAVVTVKSAIINETGNTGTGFIMDSVALTQQASAYSKEYKLMVVIVLTAGHVVKGAYEVKVLLYQNQKDVDSGKWKTRECRANVHGFDVVRDVAMLSIHCDKKCDCTNITFLQPRLSNVYDGERVHIIGDGANREIPHSTVDGRLSSTNITFAPATAIYSKINKKLAGTTFATRVHMIAGSINKGDSGSAVMDRDGNVIGMILGTSGVVSYCATMPEIVKAYEQILDAQIPRFVGCTARESALLGRMYWGGKSGKSIQEMDAIATSVNARYIAIAHDGIQAHAFTFHALWWEIFPDDNSVLEANSECLCKIDSFTDGQFLKRTKDGKVMCGCSENACRSKERFEQRFGEDNDRRWAVYKRESVNKEKAESYYVPSNESLSAMHDLAKEIYYWKKKAFHCLSELLQVKIDELDQCEQREENMRKENEEYKKYVPIVTALVVCMTVALFSCVCRNNDLKKRLKEATTDCERLRTELSEREACQGIQGTNETEPIDKSK